MSLLIISLVLFSNTLFSEELRDLKIYKFCDNNNNKACEEEITNYCENDLAGKISNVKIFNNKSDKSFKYLSPNNILEEYNEKTISTAVCKINIINLNHETINIFVVNAKEMYYTMTNICVDLKVTTSDEEKLLDAYINFDDFTPKYKFASIEPIPSLTYKNDIYNFFTCMRYYTDSY